MLSEACRLSGEQLTSYLQREGVKLADFERWRMELEDGQESASAIKHLRKLERELARKEKALSEAATLLVLKETIESLDSDKDDDANGPSER